MKICTDSLSFLPNNGAQYLKRVVAERDSLRKHI